MVAFGGGLIGLGAQAKPDQQKQQQLLGQGQNVQGGLLGLGQQAISGVGGGLAQGVNFGNAPALVGQGDLAADRQRTEDSLFGRYQSRMQPQFAQQQDALKQEMANRGIGDTNEIYKNRSRELAQTQQDSLLDAQARAISAAGDEQSRLANLGLQQRQQSINESLSANQANLGNLGGLIGLGQASQAGDIQREQIASQEGMQQAGFGFQSGESALDRANAQALQQGSIQGQKDIAGLNIGSQEKMQQAGFGFQSGQSALDRANAQSLQQGSIQGQKDIAGMNIGSQERMQQAGFSQDSAMAQKQFDYSQQLQRMGFDQQTAERFAQEQFQAGQNTQQQSWQTGENAADRQIQLTEAESNRRLNDYLWSVLQKQQSGK